MRHIFHLSTELLEHTISNILDPRDLFDLALTCKGLHNLIVPYHLYFREIVTIWDDHFDCELWNTLSQHPILARHTQTLQFVCSSEHIGLGLAKSRARVLENVDWTQAQDIFKIILKSVCRMVNLHNFMWHGMICETATLWLRGIFDGLANCLNLTSLTVDTGILYEGIDIMPPFPAQQLSFLTTLALAVPCSCKSCASTSFYQKLFFEPLETLQYVELQFAVVPIHRESPVSSQWNDVFETVNWPNLRRLTWWLCGSDVRSPLSGPILELFIARHPLMESLAYFVASHMTLDFYFALENPSKLYSLKYILLNCCCLPDTKELTRVCDLQFVNTSFCNEQPESLGSLPNLRFCRLAIRAQNFLARFVQLFSGVEKLDIALPKRPGITEMSSYIAKLEGLNKLTHLAGLLSSHNGYENDYFLKVAAETIPSLTHVEVRDDHHKVWVLIERNAEGDYMGYKVAKWYHDGPPAWGLFFFPISVIL